MKFLKSVAVAIFISTVSRIAAAYDDDKAHLKAGVEFETQRVHRGSLKSQDLVEPQLMLSKKTEKHCFYFGTKGYLPTKATHVFKNEVQFSGGNLYQLSDFFSVDFGGSYNWQPEKQIGVLRHSRELYIGVNADILLSPSIYLFHDFERRQWAMETRFGYPFELDEFGLPNTALESEFWLGFLKAKKPYGGVRGPEWDRKNKYIYFGTGLSLAFFLGENTVFKVGPRWVYNRDGNHPYSIANEYGNHSHLLWVACSLELRF